MPSLSLTAWTNRCLDPEVSFGGFYRPMTEEELNLFKLTPG
jgi:hypothetical protein